MRSEAGAALKFSSVADLQRVNEMLPSEFEPGRGR
jgi:hypothetical protein